MKEQASAVVQINEHELDKECIKLPADYLYYAHHAADLKRDVQEAEAELDVVQADLNRQVRDHPAKYGLEKETEKGIAAVVLTQRPYKEALQKVIDAKHQQEIAQSVVWALEHKKRCLTLLVDLHGMGYFANVKMSKQGKEAVEEMTKNKVRRRWQDD